MSITLIFTLSLIIILINTFSQVMLKFGMIRFDTKFNRFTYSGLFSLMLVFVLTFILLQQIELKYIAVIMALNYLGGNLSGYYFFGDKFSWKTWVGVAMICFGVVVFSL